MSEKIERVRFFAPKLRSACPLTNKAQYEDGVMGFPTLSPALLLLLFSLFLLFFFSVYYSQQAISSKLLKGPSARLAILSDLNISMNYCAKTCLVTLC